MHHCPGFTWLLTWIQRQRNKKRETETSGHSLLKQPDKTTAARKTGAMGEAILKNRERQREEKQDGPAAESPAAVWPQVTQVFRGCRIVPGTTFYWQPQISGSLEWKQSFHYLVSQYDLRVSINSISSSISVTIGISITRSIAFGCSSCIVVYYASISFTEVSIFITIKLDRSKEHFLVEYL